MAHSAQQASAMDQKINEEKLWVQVQQKTFTKWLNNHLRKGGFEPLTDVETEFDDGIRLMQVIHVLYELPIPKHNKNPKMRMHKVDNLTTAFKMIEEAQIKTNFLKNTHLLDHDLKMILGMIWAIILDYAIKGISVDEMTAKEGLLLWVRKKTAGYNHVDPPGVQNFHNSWKNGMAFCALIHRHRPKMIDYASLDPANAAENLELAFSVAEEQLDIPRLLDVSDLTDAIRPDERSVMTYVSEFFHRFASEGMKEKAAGRVQRFLQFMRGVQQQQEEYERRARALIDWCNTTGQGLADHKFGDTLEDAMQSFAAYKSHLVSSKPVQAGEKLDVEALYAEIQTELLVHDRRPYVPPPELAPEAIEVAWQTLQDAEKAHGQAVRDNRFRFITKTEVKIPQAKIDEFDAAFTHFDKDGSNKLDKVEFKAALSALGVPFKDDAAYQKVFDEVAEGQPQITREQYARFCFRLEEDKDTPESIRQAFDMMCDSSGTITVEQLQCPPLTDEDIAALQGAMPASSDGAGYDYNQFIESQFIPAQ